MLKDAYPRVAVQGNGHSALKDIRNTRLKFTAP